MLLTFILLILYISALICIGLKDHFTEDKDGFIIADRKVGILGTISSLSTSLRGGGGLIFWIGIGFALGYGFYNVIIGFIIGCILLSFIAPRARRIAKKNNYITIGQMVKNTIGIKTEKISSFIVMSFMVLTVAAQFYVLGNISTMLFGFDPFNSIIFTALIVAFYVSLGGYKSIIKTDILQFFIILSLFSTVFFIPLKTEDVFNFSSIYTSHIPSEFFIGIFQISIFVFACADFWQRIFSSKDDKTVKRSLRFTGLSLLAMTLPLTLIGMSAKNLIPADTASHDVLMTILQSNVYPQLIISLFTLATISITMSTLDTYAYTVSSTLLENFTKIDIKTQKNKYIYLSKIIMITMLLIAAVLSLRIENMIKYLLGVGSLLTILGPVFLVVGAGWIKHRSKKLDMYFMWSLIIAFSIGSYMVIQGYSSTYLLRTIPVAICIILILLSYIVVKYIHKRNI